MIRLARLQEYPVELERGNAQYNVIGGVLLNKYPILYVHGPALCYILRLIGVVLVAAVIKSRHRD